MSRANTDRLESFSKAIVIIDFVVCGLCAIGLLILMCFPIYLRDLMYRAIDELDYDSRRKEDTKPFYENVIVPFLWSGIATIILIHLALSILLAYGVMRPKLGKLNKWIKLQILLSVLTTLAILVLIVRFSQYFFGLLPLAFYQIYRFASIVIIFKYEQALIKEDEVYTKRMQYKQKMGGSRNGLNSSSRNTLTATNNNNYTPVPVKSHSLSKINNIENGGSTTSIGNGTGSGKVIMISPALQKKMYYTQLQLQKHKQKESQQQQYFQYQEDPEDLEPDPLFKHQEEHLIRQSMPSITITAVSAAEAPPRTRWRQETDV